MTQVATTMRAAFETAYLRTSRKTFERRAVVPCSLPLVRDALRRKVGLVTRRTMWSIQRGNR